MTEPTIRIVAPAGLRFRRRHVQQTLAMFVRQNLVARGWGQRDPSSDPADDPTVNFGTSPLAYVSVLSENLTINPPKLNTVSITIGDEPDDKLEQMGGGLYSVAYPLFVDVYGEAASTSIAVAGDVKAILSRQYIPVYDFTGSPPVQTDDEYIEFENVRGPIVPAREPGASAEFRRHWRQIQADAIGYFTNSEMD